MPRPRAIDARFAAAALAACVAAAPALPAFQTARPSSAFDSRQLLRDVEVLSADDMEGRLAGSPGGEKARGYVVARFREAGLAPFGEEFTHPFTFTAGRGGAQTERQGVNVVGRIAGTRRADRVVVITAHYDHIGVRNGEVFNGADDNASGTAALIAMAGHFARERPAHTLVFAALDAEESGLRGAHAFVRAPPVPLESIVVNVNMDMMGRDPDDILYAAGTYAYPFLKPYLEQVAKTAPVRLRLGHDDPTERDVEDWTRSSDHFAFHQAKIPFVYLGVEDFGQHHKATDDYATLTHDFYVRAVETAILVVKAFDASLEAIDAARAGREVAVRAVAR